MEQYLGLLKIIFAIIGSTFLVVYFFSTLNSYNYVKKNLRSICELFFGNPNYYRKLDWSNHFLLEMAVCMLITLRFREIKILKRNKIFTQGYLPLAPNLNDKNFEVLIKMHRYWYKHVARTFMFSSISIILLIVIWCVLKFGMS